MSCRWVWGEKLAQRLGRCGLVIGGLLMMRNTKGCHHASEGTQTGGSQEQARRERRSRCGRCGPAGRNELGCSAGQLNNEMELALFDAALADGEDLATEGMVRSRNAHTLDVIGIQPRSMLVGG